MMGHNRIVEVLMGPTASGKSALALEVAAKRAVVIINADAMQMYDGLRVVTARPSEAELASAEHALYGVWAPESQGTAARWAAEAARVIEQAFAEGKRPLLVGGTGMYIRALTEGLSEIPVVAAGVREEIRGEVESGEGRGKEKRNKERTEALYAALEKEDPVMAARLKPGDTQRIMRALEVVRSTGVSLAVWQETKGEPLVKDVTYRTYAILPERKALYETIDRRFLAMLEQGAIDEVGALLARNLDVHAPILRAVGVPELAAYIRGESTKEVAISKAQQHSRNYAKRQMTWIRQQCAGCMEGREILTQT